MDIKTLKRLESLNQLKLTEEEEAEVLAFFERMDGEIAGLRDIDTDNVERMVHVMPMVNVFREDAAHQEISREQLQDGAPDAFDGYWRVPRLVD